MPRTRLLQKRLPLWKSAVFFVKEKAAKLVRVEHEKVQKDMMILCDVFKDNHFLFVVSEIIGTETQINHRIYFGVIRIGRVMQIMAVQLVPNAVQITVAVELVDHEIGFTRKALRFGGNRRVHIEIERFVQNGFVVKTNSG